jgi:hypothetical protein
VLGTPKPLAKPPAKAQARGKNRVSVEVVEVVVEELAIERVSTRRRGTKNQKLDGFLFQPPECFEHG